MAKRYISLLLYFTVLLASITGVHYYVPRHEQATLFLALIVAFVAYLLAVKQSNQLSLPVILWLASLVRLVLFFGLPTLSDDFYRFIWDGRLLVSGINPFSQLPSYYLSNPFPGYSKEIFELLNSKEYFTIYPPISQLIFWISATLGNHQMIMEVFWMRLILALFDLGNVLLIYRIVKSFGGKSKAAMLYALNPLIILELIGNLHYEGVMIFFVLCSVYFLKLGRDSLSSVGMSLGVAAKLIPLLFLPYFLKFEWKSIRYYLIFFASLIVCFLPLVSQELVDGLYASISLFFVKFEFNASLYFLFREIGYYLEGYNLIGIIGPLLKLVTVVLVLFIAYAFRKRRNDEMVVFMLMYFTYLAFSTTVHPWYVIPVLTFSLFTSFNFAIVWSGLVFLSYVGYSLEGYQPNYWAFVLEYAPVYALFGWELYKKKQYADVNI